MGDVAESEHRAVGVGLGVVMTPQELLRLPWFDVHPSAMEEIEFFLPLKSWDRAGWRLRIIQVEWNSGDSPEHFELWEVDGVPYEDGEVDGFFQRWLSVETKRNKSQTCSFFVVVFICLFWTIEDSIQNCTHISAATSSIGHQLLISQVLKV